MADEEFVVGWAAGVSDALTFGTAAMSDDRRGIGLVELCCCWSSVSVLRCELGAVRGAAVGARVALATVTVEGGVAGVTGVDSMTVARGAGGGSLNVIATAAAKGWKKFVR